MSVESFMKARCPMKDSETPDYDGTMLGAAKHSLYKWEGVADPKVLEEHGLRVVPPKPYGGYKVRDEFAGETMDLSYNTCALCHDNKDVFGGIVCSGCPLAQVAGSCITEDSPYNIFALTGDAKPLVDALRAVVKQLEKESTNDQSLHRD